MIIEMRVEGRQSTFDTANSASTRLKKRLMQHEWCG